jgi:hypothetical protein
MKPGPRLVIQIAAGTVLAAALLTACSKPQRTITGQVFIATKGGANVAIAGQEVCLVSESGLLNYVSSKVVEWTNELVQAQLKVERATGDNLDQAVAEQARLFHRINFPAPSSLALAWLGGMWFDKKTDLEGRFRFIIPATSEYLRVIVKAERQVFDSQEELWFEQSFYLHGQNTDIILSDKDINSSGLFIYSGTNDPFFKFMLHYSVGIETAKMDREHATFMKEHGIEPVDADADTAKAKVEIARTKAKADAIRSGLLRTWNLTNGHTLSGYLRRISKTAIWVQEEDGEQQHQIPRSALESFDQERVNEIEANPPAKRQE